MSIAGKWGPWAGEVKAGLGVGWEAGRRSKSGGQSEGSKEESIYLVRLPKPYLQGLRRRVRWCSAVHSGRSCSQIWVPGLPKRVPEQRELPTRR